MFSLTVKPEEPFASTAAAATAARAQRAAWGRCEEPPRGRR